MDERRAIELIRAYCAGSVSPGEFELAFYSEDSCMETLLGDRSKHWPFPVKDSPYFDLLELSLTQNVKEAREILRAFLQTCTPEPATPELLDKVERRLGVRLPAAYREFVTKNDLGRFRKRSIAVAGPVSENLQPYLSEGKWTIYNLFGPSLDEDDPRSILQTLPMRKEWQLPKGLVLLDGDGHTWTALDYRADPNNPPVVFVESDTGETLVLAKSMEEFLANSVEKDSG